MAEVSLKRTRTACEPCHRRKRKCNGLQPCHTCSRNGYQCHYGSRSREQAVERPGTGSESAGPEVGAGQRSLTANSGILFVRDLLRKIDPANAPRTQLSAWNVGARASLTTDPPSSASTIRALLSHAQMTALAYAYFDKVDPCYGFIERTTIFQQINNRWLVSPFSAEPFDAVLCGVAALGSYFSKALAVPTEYQLVQLAKSILDGADLSNAPDADTVTAWVCRVIYLRLTAAPFAAWIASCTTMHMFEAAGVHRDAYKDDTALGQASSSLLPPVLGRAFGVAQHLNTWISYDLGLSRVRLEGPAAVPTSSTNANYTDKLLELLPISLELHNAECQDDTYLRSTLATIVAKHDEQPPLVMAQCNLLLCILRQLHFRNSLRADHDPALASALHFLTKGLAAARQMVEDDCPWHHLANVPFQMLCTLLAIDTPASLRMVDKVMQTFQKVIQAYDTVTLNDAYSTACLLLAIHRKRRRDDAQTIDNVLSRLVAQHSTPNAGQDDGGWSMPSESESAWFSNLVGVFPSLQNFDVGELLNDQLTEESG